MPDEERCAPADLTPEQALQLSTVVQQSVVDLLNANPILAQAPHITAHALVEVLTQMLGGMVALDAEGKVLDYALTLLAESRRRICEVAAPPPMAPGARSH